MLRGLRGLRVCACVAAGTAWRRDGMTGWSGTRGTGLTWRRDGMTGWSGTCGAGLDHVRGRTGVSENR